jgi:hypothetical protein
LTIFEKLSIGRLLARLYDRGQHAVHAEDTTMRYLMLIYLEEAKLKAERERVGDDAYTGKWFAYRDGLGKAGKLLAGEALMPVATATTVRGKSGGGTLTTDGPFVETKETLGGYFMVDAESLDDAIGCASKMPVFQIEGGVEIRPIMEFDWTAPAK